MEMAGVMSQSIKIDDGFLAREEEIRSRLVTENKVSILENSYSSRSDK